MKQTVWSHGAKVAQKEEMTPAPDTAVDFPLIMISRCFFVAPVTHVCINVVVNELKLQAVT